ncbi:uncharacterized protein [Ptychodera flava]|uniref:uncharacterized protein n=1 Tax=Ptychodera flava TaxID=63121 RepID=UPI00396AAB11
MEKHGGFHACSVFITTMSVVSALADVSPFLDMSYPFKTGETIYWPTARPFELEVVHSGETEDGIYLEMNNFCAAEHGGTHVDAPAHFSEGRYRVHDISLDTLIGPAIKIDIKDKADTNSDAELTISDLQAWEQTNGRIPDDVILLVDTGWGSRWPNRTLFLGTETNDTSLLHFPGIRPDTAQWLVDNRKIKAIGIDTPSIDYGQSVLFEAHRILFEDNIPGLENVANLDKLPTTGATIYAVPIGIHDGSGAPTRIFATGWRSDVPEPCNMEASGPSPFLDLSYRFKENETIYMSVARPFEFEIGFRGVTDNNFYYEGNNYCASEHGGTHMDAPSHFAQGRHQVHDVRLDTLIGPAIKVDIKAKADEDSLAMVEVADLEAWEEVNGRIPDDVILMVYSGWGARWPDRAAYLGTETNNASLLQFPGIHPDAARWIANNRKIKCVGIDTPSVDNGQSTTYDTHVILFEKNIPALENVANLDKLPTKGATVFALPMKIYGGSGAPARIFATGWNPDLYDPCDVVGSACHPTFDGSLLLSIGTAIMFVKLAR